jgi:hypothetical protein
MFLPLAKGKKKKQTSRALFNFLPPTNAILSGE